MDRAPDRRAIYTSPDHDSAAGCTDLPGTLGNEAVTLNGVHNEMVHDLIKRAAMRTGVSVLAMALVAGAAWAQDEEVVPDEDFVVTDGTGEAGEDIVIILTDEDCIECSGGIDEGWVDEGEIFIDEDGNEYVYDPEVVYMFDGEVEEGGDGSEDPEVLNDGEGEVEPTAADCENRMCESGGIEPNWRSLAGGNDSGPTHREMREADPFPGVEVPNICLSDEFYVSWLCDWQMANQGNW
jgi:hypothetical protein